jgi:hypothetical protein
LTAGKNVKAALSNTLQAINSGLCGPEYKLENKKFEEINISEYLRFDIRSVDALKKMGYDDVKTSVKFDNLTANIYIPEM